MTISENQDIRSISHTQGDSCGIRSMLEVPPSFLLTTPVCIVAHEPALSKRSSPHDISIFAPGNAIHPPSTREMSGMVRHRFSSARPQLEAWIPLPPSRKTRSKCKLPLRRIGGTPTLPAFSNVMTGTPTPAGQGKPPRRHLKSVNPADQAFHGFPPQSAGRAGPAATGAARQQALPGEHQSKRETPEGGGRFQNTH